MRFLKDFIRKKLIEWLDLPEKVVFDNCHGEIRKIDYKQNCFIIVYCDHYYPHFHIKRLKKFFDHVIYLPSDTKLQEITNLQNLKDIRKEFIQKIDKWIIECA